MTSAKFKKIMLIAALLSGIFYSTPTSAQYYGTIEPAKPSCPKCLQYEYCDDATGGQCVTKKKDGDECANTNGYQCQSGVCELGQGNVLRCISPTGDTGYLQFKPTAPKLEVDVPTLQPFTTAGMEKPDAEGNIYIPFIGQYIVGIYKWALSVAGIIATIMIILGGFTYLTSGGDATRAGEGKERIGAAIFGLILLLGSYMLLYLLNPDLVQFKSLKINVIKTVNLDDLVIENLGAGETVGVPKKLEDPTYDAIFQKFSACAPVDWHILKTMAYKESGLNADIVNKYGFTGLFQTKEENCQTALNKYPSWKNKCNNLKDPEVNTAVGSQMLKSSIKLINETCANASLIDKLILIYLGHNSGPGAIKYAMNPANGGCDALNIQKGIINFWEQHKNGQFAGQGLGKKRFDYAMSVANLITSQGVTDLAGTGQNFTCPF